MAINWYIVRTRTGYEQKVKNFLLHSIKEFKFEKSFGDIVIPSEEVVEMRGGTKRKTQRKIFPGYVLVQMELTDATWHFVKNAPHVTGFIDVGGKPTPLSDAQAKDILQKMEEGAEKPKPKVLYEPGEVIRIVDGPFTDFNGVVEEVNYDKNLVRVSVLIFGRSTPVDLEFGQIQKG